jgi:hypothetical protein
MSNTSFDGSFAVTNTGASRRNEMLVYGRAFQLYAFQAGAGGHDSSTLLPKAVDLTLTTLPSPTTSLITLTTGALVASDFRTTQLTLTLGTNVGTGVLSNVGIYGKVFAVADTVNDSGLVGNTFLYAVCNLGYSQKASNSTRTLTLLLHSI